MTAAGILSSTWPKDDPDRAYVVCIYVSLVFPDLASISHGFHYMVILHTFKWNTVVLDTALLWAAVDATNIPVLSSENHALIEGSDGWYFTRETLAYKFDISRRKYQAISIITLKRIPMNSNLQKWWSYLMFVMKVHKDFYIHSWE